MKPKRALQYEFKPRTLDYIISLACYPNYTKLLNPSDKPYKEVLEWFLSREEYFSQEDCDYPPATTIAKEIGISPARVTTAIKAIYEDIFKLNEKSPELFMKEGQVLCRMSFHNYGMSFLFNVGLDVMPRVGDSFNFLFLRGKTNFWYYNVKRVFHEVEKGRHDIFISLSSEETNNYYELLKEKAYLHGAISSMEFINPENPYKLKEELLRLYKNL